MKRYLVCVGLLLAGAISVAPAWWVKGHESIAEAAAMKLPEKMPAFFRGGGKTMAHCSGDPDRWKNPSATYLRAAESQNHYIDLEDLDGNTLPADRNKAAAMIAKLKRRPELVGMLPYAIQENFERLCCAFKDYRDDPKNPAVQAKCLVYAGILAHYTGDAAMPLHTTRDYDGKKGADGKMVQRGIHAKIDAFPEKNNLTPEEICRGLEAQEIKEVWSHVRKTIDASFEHVKKCYELDQAGGFDKPTADSRAFILERCRVAAQLTMDLWYTAWLVSEKMPAHY